MDPTKVVVHPLVLLSTVDHYNRVAKDFAKKRVVGALLGSVDKNGQVDVTNSYALPFDEDDHRPEIWFLDHNYHENMYSMFKSVNAREKLVGWYSTGPKIRSSDLDVHNVFNRYFSAEMQQRGMSVPISQPVFVIVDVQPKELGIPTKSYITVEEVTEDGKETTLRFQHLPSEIGALEAEEVGVEHLLRDVKDNAISSLANDVQHKLLALKSLETHLQETEDYLNMVIAGKLPLNHQIINQIQDIFNLLPNLNVESLTRSFAVKTNDMSLAIYLASLIRSIIALHNLINNKIANRKLEQKAEANLIAAEEQQARDLEDIRKIKERQRENNSNNSNSNVNNSNSKDSTDSDRK